MEKWEELRDYVIQVLVQAGTGENPITEKAFKATLNKMEALDTKYHKQSVRKNRKLQRAKTSVERYEKALKEIARWDEMFYSPNEMGEFAKDALRKHHP
ncbi:hypothetical protein HXA34_20470 [Salipaludibacillus agaradhaerens]|uniref:hypothetical protein n=1 Tax=Salipaludibacillus agaradhaerens TaxID=76935 RepID=UPI0021507C08|nr:hypothetical protein [Salipaludibacillus agaradhaerens]MCR6108673.1 hypothetical protein [Salipaludibacillus agaradhaerens]MCR6120697.1 hypothetical protein [Salipaludibacillus agaradhaerens]